MTPMKKGRHGTHEGVVIEVTLCRDEHGRVYSTHDLQGEEDKEIALSWPSGGMEQAAFALLAEAVRREALLDLFLKMSQDPKYAENLQKMTEDERQGELIALSRGVTQTVTNTVSRLAFGAIEDALRVVLPPNG